ncbi:MAG: TIGR02921 family PEP-CTERM protein [Pseudomonadota bacterium]
MPNPKTIWPFVLKCAVALFWCWNVVFICSTLPMLPAVPLLLTEWWQGDVPFDYAFILLTWMVVPCLCVWLACTRLRGRPDALAFLFFAVEGPFYSLCLYRLIIMRELSPAVSQWLLVAVLGLCVHAYHSWVRPLPATRAWHAVRLMASTGLALAALYAGALVLIAWSPAALRGIFELFNPINWLHLLQTLTQGFFLLFLIPVFGVLFLLTAGSLLAMPLCMAVLCLGSLLQAWRSGALTLVQRVAAVVSMLVLQGLFFMHLNHQPQQEAFALLASPMLTATQFQDKAPVLRAGLLNAYLGAYRYASSTGESTAVGTWYRQLLKLPAEVAALPNAAFNALAKPMLYDGPNMAADAKHAAELYEQYFDTPIQRGERSAIAQALSATYNQDERESGLINIDQRKVHVTEQSVRVDAHGDLARITLDETYVNLTTEQQEIFYLFSLPESAAITGLWLGEDRDHMQAFTIASRGAAQRVYKAEVQRRVDPALLEQVGPRQYRLRAFPVPPRPQAHRARNETAGAKLYLRLEYTALASNSAWPLPVLAEKRNVAWDRHTQRLCNGTVCPGDVSTWWPKELPMAHHTAPTRHAYRVGPQGPTIVAQPATTAPPAVSGKKVALVLDRSWSMAAHRQELLKALTQFQQQSAGNTVSVLLSTTPVMQETPRWVPLADVTQALLTGFMGGGHVDQLLQQASTHIPEAQDLTIVLTDNGAFDLSKDKARTRLNTGMLSMVHLGGAMAPAYDDATLESIQASGGSAFASLQDAWDHFARQQNAAPGFLMQRDGYAFSVVDSTGDAANDAAFAPLAARLWIARATLQTAPLALPQLAALHTIAQSHGVVTPYSSMLVLVNTQQEEALAKAEAGDDRFERAQEPGTETLQKPSNPLTANITPEPEEWLLLLVSLAVATWMVRARRAERLNRQKSPARNSCSPA